LGYEVYLNSRVSQVLKTLDNEQAGVEETLDAVRKACFFATVQFVVHFADTFVPASIGESVDGLLEIQKC
jgi:DNA-binding transcriptional regulator GbsR (MarR family)